MPLRGGSPSIETEGTAQMTNELPKLMAEIAAEIEAKKALPQGAQDGARAMRKAGKATAEIMAWARAA
jgi:hypothetical protein